VIKKIKTNQRLEQILLNFIDVLRINIFIVDNAGNPVLMPRSSGLGWNLSACKRGILQDLGTPQFLARFHKEGHYLLSVDPFELQSFAIPIPSEIQATGYLIVGPVVLNKRLEPSRYQEIALDFGLNLHQFTESLNEIRVVSFNSLKSILDLLFDLSQYAIKVIDKDNSSVKDDHFLIENHQYIFKILLDLTMALTQAECGSIMLFDKTAGELHIKVHKGLGTQNVEDVRVKIGEGIAGIAAQDKTPFVINEGSSVNNRIKHLLKKPELKCAIVLPIVDENNHLIGVINVATRQAGSVLAANSGQMLKTLANITSSAIERIL